MDPKFEAPSCVNFVFRRLSFLNIVHKDKYLSCHCLHGELISMSKTCQQMQFSENILAYLQNWKFWRRWFLSSSSALLLHLLITLYVVFSLTVCSCSHPCKTFWNITSFLSWCVCWHLFVVGNLLRLNAFACGIRLCLVSKSTNNFDLWYNFLPELWFRRWSWCSQTFCKSDDTNKRKTEYRVVIGQNRKADFC